MCPGLGACRTLYTCKSSARKYPQILSSKPIILLYAISIVTLFPERRKSEECTNRQQAPGKWQIKHEFTNKYPTIKELNFLN